MTSPKIVMPPGSEILSYSLQYEILMNLCRAAKYIIQLSPLRCKREVYAEAELKYN